MKLREARFMHISASPLIPNWVTLLLLSMPTLLSLRQQRVYIPHNH